MGSVWVHPNALIHGLTERDILDAWNGGGPRMPRCTLSEEETVGVGWTRYGKAVQLVAITSPVGALIVHALPSPTRNVMKELGCFTCERR